MNKEMDLGTAVSHLRDGMSIGFGGWGARRKPMALVREIIRSDLKDLTVVSFGGPEVGMLCAAGKVSKLVYGFVSMDVMPLEPWFRKTRESGAVEVEEWDEGLFILGLRAAAEKVPFAPSRLGMGTDILTCNPRLKTVRSPYGDRETLIAMAAIQPDLALLHVSRADRLGNTQTDGPDPYFDALFARAAGRVIVSAEEVTDRLDLSHPEGFRNNLFDRYLVEGVVHAPCGAHPTTAHDSYGWDAAHLKTYAGSAEQEGGWSRYVQEFIAPGEAAYIERVGGPEAIAGLPIPKF
jgi:glutaconate CoA-transferase subunit A